MEQTNRTFKAYLSEPITRCPVRERGRIQRLVDQIKTTLEVEPFFTRLYIPSLVSDPLVRKSLTPEHVYLLDRIRIVEADFLLVLADHTSFGVGGEVEMATNLGKPIIFFSREKKLSRFLLGTPVNVCKTLKEEKSQENYYIHYREWRDLKTPLLQAVEHVQNYLSLPHSPLPHWDISSNLKALRMEQGLTQEELAKSAGVLLPQLVLWEKSLDEVVGALQAYQRAGQLDLDPIELNSTQLEQLSNPSVNALHKLSAALNVSVSDLLGDTTNYFLQKGPKKISQQMSFQRQRSRNEALELRAFQFDVTFREFKKLKKILIDETQDLSEWQAASNHDRISEEEFLEALNKIRLKNRNLN